MVATATAVVLGAGIPTASAATASSGLTTTEHRSLSEAGAFTTHPVRFLLVGDSMAATLAIGLGAGSQSHYGVRLIDRAVLGCELDDFPSIISDHIDQPVSTCAHWRTLWATEVDQFRPEVVGLLVGRWDLADQIVDGRVVSVGQPAWDTHIFDDLDQAVSLFSAHGAKVVLLTVPDIDAADEAPGSAAYSENDPARVTEWNAIVSRVVSHRRGVATLVNLNRVLDPHGVFQLVVHGVTVRWPDGVHISRAGGVWLQPQVLPTVGRLGLEARSAGGHR